MKNEGQKWIVAAAGASLAIAAYLIANNRAASRRPIPVTVAAQKLQQAWADHHTYA